MAYQIVLVRRGGAIAEIPEIVRSATPGLGTVIEIIHDETRLKAQVISVTRSSLLDEHFNQVEIVTASQV